MEEIDELERYRRWSLDHLALGLVKCECKYKSDGCGGVASDVWEGDVLTLALCRKCIRRSHEAGCVDR
jgi:hypothetical protein